MGGHSREWLNQRADHVEKAFAQLGVRARVVGGAVKLRRIVMDLTMDSPSPFGDLHSLGSDLATALGMSCAHLERDNGRVRLSLPRPDAPNISLMRLQARLSPLPPLTALIGRDEQGSPLLLHVPSPEVAHILAAGGEGSGKTTLARAILTSLALGSDADELRLVLVDLGSAAFTPFTGLSHLAGPLLRGGREAERRLHWLAEEMQWRKESGVQVPRIVVAVDEVAALVKDAPGVHPVLWRLAAAGSEVGLHLLLCTQRPGAEEIGELLRANLRCRLVGRVASPEESRLATGLDGTGAERLLGRGDFLLLAGGEIIRLQAVSVEPGEIAALAALSGEEQRRPALRQGSRAR